MVILKGFVLWFTGLSGSGKTTIATALYKKFDSMGLSNIELLDGDIIRKYINSDLGFSKKDRIENIRRVAFIAKLLSRNGVGVLATFISPYLEMREYTRNNVSNFIEVFVDTPLSVCEERDVKGLYKKARSGEISNFTGISDVYEKPTNPDIVIKTEVMSEIDSVQLVVKYLYDGKYIS